MNGHKKAADRKHRAKGLKQKARLKAEAAQQGKKK